MLSAKLVSHLPGGPITLDPAACTELLSLKSSMEGSYGETYLLASGDALYALTRASAIDGFELFALSAERPPTIEGKGWKTALRIHTDDGVSHELKLSDEERTTALRVLAQRYIEQGAWRAYIEIMHRRLDDLTGNDRLQALLDIGDMYLTRLEQPESAYTCFAEVLEHDSRVDSALAGMERIVQDGRMLDTIVPILEQRYRQRSDDEKLAWIMSVKAPTLTTAPQRAAAYVEAARLMSHVANAQERAVTLAGSGLIEAPHDTDIVQLVDELAERSNAWERACEAWETALTGDIDVDVRRALLSRIATASADRLQAWERAESAARALLACDDADARGWRVLDQIFTANERWDALIDVLDRRAQLQSDDSERVPLWHRAGGVLYDQLSDPDRAIEMYERVLATRSDHDASYEQLHRIHRQRKDLAAECDLLSRWAAAQHDRERRIELRIALADACEQREDYDRAIDAWRRVLVDKPADVHGLRNLARLEQTIENWPKALEALVQLARAEKHSTPERYLEAATLARESMSNRDRALEILVEASQVYPGERHLLMDIRSLAKATNRDRALADALRALLDLLPESSADVLECRIELAETVQRLGPVDEAIGLWRDVLAIESMHTRALDGLYELYTTTEKWTQVVDIVDKQLAASTTDEQRIDAFLDLARIYRTYLGDEHSAADALQHVLALAPTNTDAADALIELLSSLQRWQSLVDVHRLCAVHAVLTPERAHHLLAASEVLEHRLEQPSTSVEILVNAFEDCWLVDAFADEIARLAIATNTEQQTLTALERSIASISSNERSGYLQRLDHILHQFGGQIHDDALLLAIGVHYEVVRNDGAAAAARYWRVTSPANEVEAMRRLRSVLRDAYAFAELSEVLEKMAVSERLPASERRGALRELADILADHLDQPERANELRRQNRSSLPLVIGVALIIVAAIAAYVLIG